MIRRLAQRTEIARESGVCKQNNVWACSWVKPLNSRQLTQLSCIFWRTLRKVSGPQVMLIELVPPAAMTLRPSC